MSREEQFDDMLLEMVQQHGNNFQDLLGTIFSFLARKTNFYTAGEDAVEELVISELRKYRNITMSKNDDKAECGEQEKKQKEDEEKAIPSIIKIKNSLIAKLTDEFAKIYPAELEKEDTESISEKDKKIRSLENFCLLTEALIHTEKAERAQIKKKQFLENYSGKTNCKNTK